MSMFSLFAILLVAGVIAMGVAALIMLVVLLVRGRTGPSESVES